MKNLIQKLENYIKTYVKNAGKQGVVLGISGGIDSALCASLAVNALGKDRVKALLLPTKDSVAANIKDALSLCGGLAIEYKLIYIDKILQSFLEVGAGECLLVKGNLCARIRMCLLYDYSVSFDSLVIGSSNKSELSLGYGTIYGDLAYAFNPLGDIYKSDLYDLADYLGLDSCFLDKAPSADLWPNQSDEAELGYSYAQIDAFLKAKEAKADLDQFDPDLVLDLQDRIKANAFKQKIGDIYKL